MFEEHEQLLKQVFPNGAVKRVKVKGRVTDAIYDVFQVFINNELIYQTGVELIGYTRTELALKDYLCLRKP